MTDTNPTIDPAVYRLGLFPSDEVEASKAWVEVLGGGARRTQFLVLAAASALTVAAFSVQILHSETIDLITIVTD